MDKSTIVICVSLFALAVLECKYIIDSKPERETVSFNDGAQICDNLEISRYAPRQEISQALRSAATSVDQIGCVNITFLEN